MIVITYFQTQNYITNLKDQTQNEITNLKDRLSNAEQRLGLTESATSSNAASSSTASSSIQSLQTQLNALRRKRRSVSQEDSFQYSECVSMKKVISDIRQSIDRNDLG